VKKGEQFRQFKAPLSVAGRSYGDQWIAASYTVTSPTQEKQFVLEAVRGSYTTAYLAIDQVSMTDGPCSVVGEFLREKLSKKISVADCVNVKKGSTGTQRWSTATLKHDLRLTLYIN
jgi:MAM domain, meprin/A5/mu